MLENQDWISFFSWLTFSLAQIFEKNELVLVWKKKNSRIDHKIQESRSYLPLGPSANCILKICLEDVNFFVDK